MKWKRKIAVFSAAVIWILCMTAGCREQVQESENKEEIVSLIC